MAYEERDASQQGYNPIGDEASDEQARQGPPASAPPPPESHHDDPNIPRTRQNAFAEDAPSENDEPEVFQSEQDGLTSKEPADFKELKGYKSTARAAGPQYDFSKLPPGGSGARAGLEGMLGRKVTPLEEARARAFLDTIAYSEGTAQIGYKANGGQGYDVQVGGKIVEATQHPHQVVQLTPTLASSAYGRYQFLGSTWDQTASKLHLTNMSPAAQDVGALYQLKQAGALEDVLQGRPEIAMTKSSGVWASLPGKAGEAYGQHQNSVQKLSGVYAQALNRQEQQIAASLPAEARSSNFPSLRLASTLTPVNSAHPVVFGDSLAVGAGSLIPGSKVHAVVGSHPDQVNGQIDAHRTEIANNTVIVSGGASNGKPSDLSKLSGMLDKIQASGARLTVVMGTANEGPNGSFKGYNQQIEHIVQDKRKLGMNVEFAGAIPNPGQDGVHPANYNYHDTVAGIDAAYSKAVTREKMAQMTTPKPDAVAQAAPVHTTAPVVTASVAPKAAKVGLGMTPSSAA